MRALPLLLLLLLAPLSARAEVARVVSIVDGDTGYYEMRGTTVKVRVADLDTPEVGDKAKCEAERIKGEQASAFVKGLLPPGRMVEVIPTGQREKWGRLLARVRFGIFGQDLASLLIERGLGVRYSGRTKPDWCGGR